MSAQILMRSQKEKPHTFSGAGILYHPSTHLLALGERPLIGTFF
jgi:hypothetical protein